MGSLQTTLVQVALRSINYVGIVAGRRCTGGPLWWPRAVGVNTS